MSKGKAKKNTAATVRMLTRISPAIIRLYFSTLKIRWLCPGPDNGGEVGTFKSYIYAFWHQRQLLFAYTHQYQGVTVLISQHRDGELIAKTVEGLGFNTIRGSNTHRGREALFQMIQVTGHDLAFTPDGPKGPCHRFKPGAIFAAAKTGYPIIPATYSCKNFWQFHSWDQFILPKPFTRAVVQTRKPFYVPPEADKDVKSYTKRLEKILQDLTEETDRNFEKTWSKASPLKPYFFATRTKSSK